MRLRILPLLAVAVCIGHASLLAASPQILAVGGVTAIGDFNGDGTLDTIGVLVVSSQAYLKVSLNNGSGQFSTGPVALLPLASGAFVYSIAVADFDGDGKLDAAVQATNPATGGGDIFVALQRNRTFAISVIPLAFGLNGDVAAGDFNSDLRPDLVVATNGGTFVAFNLGQGVFSAPVLVAPNTYPGVTVADLNRDGKPDLIFWADAADVRIYLGDGLGGFSPFGTVTFKAGLGWLIAADLNGDGKLDLVAVNFFGSFAPMTFAVARGNGDGTFKAPIFPGGAVPFDRGLAIGVADFDRDGRADVAILVSSPTPAFVVYKNLGNYAFGPPVTTRLPNVEQSIALVDLSGDGLPDLLASPLYGFNTNYLFVNNGVGGFAGTLN